MSLKIFLMTYMATGLVMAEVTGLIIGFQQKIKPLIVCSIFPTMIEHLLRLNFKSILADIFGLLFWPITCALAWYYPEELFKNLR